MNASSPTAWLPLGDGASDSRLAEVARLGGGDRQRAGQMHARGQEPGAFGWCLWSAAQYPGFVSAAELVALTSDADALLDPILCLTR